jgi:hypothetical protein
MLRSQQLPKQLTQMAFGAKGAPRTPFRDRHAGIPDEHYEHLSRFLNATMDESRLFHAEKFARYVLKETDIDDLRYFRRAVLTRELSATIGYQRQRDHAAHTLHNYLLGWFFLIHCDAVRDEARRQFERRIERPGWSEIDYFYSIWPIASLLHDIGYLFEGSVSTRDFRSASETAARGAEYANDFFTHHFWHELGLETAAEKQCALRLAGIEMPAVDGTTLVAIADSLRLLPSMNAINKQLAAVPHSGPRDIELLRDAFQLWAQHYRSFGSDKMAERICCLRTADEEMMTNGLPGTVHRVLDHGIYGALLQLQVSTLWFSLFSAVASIAKPSDPVEARVWETFNSPSVINKSHVAWFWSAIVWTTASVAFHNIAQMGKRWPGSPDDADLRLRLDEDVLTYLATLVDILEEWDRYTVARESIFKAQEDLPIQATEVQIGVGKDGSIRITYPTRSAVSKVYEALEKSLVGWQAFVKVTSKRT